MKKYLFVAIAFILVGCGVATEPTESDVNRLNDHAGISTSSSPVKAPPPASKIIESGDWEVGKKDNLAAGVITSGTYVVTAEKEGFGCYWATVRNFENTLDSIVANGNVDPGSSVRVVVKSSYAGLQLQGDCLAKKK